MYAAAVAVAETVGEEIAVFSAYRN